MNDSEGVKPAPKVCVCGRRCKSAAGFTNHVRRCVPASGFDAVAEFHAGQRRAEAAKRASKREAERFTRERLHQRCTELDLFDRWTTADSVRRSGEMALRLGMLCNFTAEELGLLSDLGFLSSLDRGLLSLALATSQDDVARDGACAHFLAADGLPSAPKADR